MYNNYYLTFQGSVKGRKTVEQLKIKLKAESPLQLRAKLSEAFDIVGALKVCTAEEYAYVVAKAVELGAGVPRVFYTKQVVEGVF